jgi:hypothetical protein
VLTFWKTASAIFLKVWAAVKQDSINESELATVIKFSVI